MVTLRRPARQLDYGSNELECSAPVGVLGPSRTAASLASPSVTHSLHLLSKFVRIRCHRPLTSPMHLSEGEANMCVNCILGVVKVHVGRSAFSGDDGRRVSAALARRLDVGQVGWVWRWQKQRLRRGAGGRARLAELEPLAEVGPAGLRPTCDRRAATAPWYRCSCCGYYSST